MTLTDRQKFVLLWLHNNHQSRARWLRNGKAAYGNPETWDAMEVGGRDGTIRVTVADWKAIQPFKEAPGFEVSGKIWRPNEAGLKELGLVSVG